MVLNTICRRCLPVLHLIETAGRRRRWYRYHDRTESWFEVVSFCPPARRDLRPLAARLQELEGSPRGPVRWCADPPTDPVPELYHGIPSPQEYGQITRTLTPTRLDPARVETECAAYLATKKP